MLKQLLMQPLLSSPLLLQLGVNQTQYVWMERRIGIIVNRLSHTTMRSSDICNNLHSDHAVLLYSRPGGAVGGMRG